jgi:hypothetical protein
VLFDDDLAVEIPDTLDLEEVLDRAGWLSRTGVYPADLGIQVTVFAGRTHPQFAHNVFPPTEAENLWAWVATIGAVGTTAWTPIRSSPRWSRASTSTPQRTR